MGRTVKRRATPKAKRKATPDETAKDLLDLVTPPPVDAGDEGDDPLTFTRKELEKEWGLKERKVLAKLHELTKLGKAVPVMAKRQGLHGPLMVKAYRLTP